MEQGLVATMVEAPLELQSSLTIPAEHFEACVAGNVPFTGNAAGNTGDLLDLSGANSAPKPLPAGFTPRGIVALVFSVLAALVGLVAITWYGMADMGTASEEAEKKRMAESNVSDSAEL